MHLYLWSCFFLAVTWLTCLIGLASPKFNDNLFQCIGMAGLAFACASRVSDLWQNEPDIPWDWFMVHFGMGMFSLGTFWKVYLRERHARFLSFAASRHWFTSSQQIVPAGAPVEDERQQ